MLEDLFNNHLHRYVTREEQRALTIVERMIRESLANARAEKYQLEQEAAHADRQIESLKMKIFVAQWEGVEDEPAA